MFVDEVRAAVMASPRSSLPALAAALWKSHAAGAIYDDDAQSIAELIEARKTVSCWSTPAGTTAMPRRVGSRPKSAESLARRRRWVAAGWMPPALACHFTQGELAALALIASEVMKHGRCDLYVEQIAAFAGVARSTVKRATRQAQAHGLLRVEVWKITPVRNGSNRITIISKEWGTWLRFRARRDHNQTVQSESTTQSSSYLSSDRPSESQRCKEPAGRWKRLVRRTYPKESRKRQSDTHSRTI